MPSRRCSCLGYSPRCGIALRALTSAFVNFSRPARAGERSRTPGNRFSPILKLRAIDIAAVPIDDVPARFAEQVLYEEDFVITMRAGHPFALKPSPEHYCEMQHVVVSQTGDDHGILDDALAKLGLSRRVLLTVPTFVSALAAVAETDLIAAVPRRFLSIHRRQFGLEAAEPPIPLERSRIRAIATRASMMDAGLAWLFNLLAETVHHADIGPQELRRGAARHGPSNEKAATEMTEL